MNKKYFHLIIVSAVSLALSFLYCPLYDLYFDDKEIFKYTGFLIKKGNIPYKDFFDHKPPLIYFINYIGAIFGSWGLWAFNASLVLFTTIKFFKLNVKFNICFPVVLPILFNLILRNNIISFGIGMTREYTTILLLLSFCVILGTSKVKYFYLGILAALIFFIQQDQIIILIPFLIYALFKDAATIKKLLNRFLFIFLGSLIVLLPITTYFSLNNALNQFWQDAFVFNTKWYTSPHNKPGVIAEIIKLKNYIYQLKFEIIFIGSILLGAVSLFAGNKNKWLLIAALIAVPLSFISEFLSGKLAIGDAVCTYYLLPLAATLPILIFIAFAFTEKEIFKIKVHQFIYGFLFLFNPVLGMAEYVSNAYRYPQDYFLQAPEIKYLEKNPPADYQLYVFNNSNYICAYNKFKIVAPSKWLYHYFWRWYPDWDKDNAIIQSIIDDLKKHKTKYIINFSNENEFKIKRNQQSWDNFLDSFYQQIYPHKLWQLKQ